MFIINTMTTTYKKSPSSPFSQFVVQRLNADVCLLLLSYMNTYQMIQLRRVNKEFQHFVESADFTWKCIFERYAVAFPWIFRPSSARLQVLRLAQLQKTIAPIVPVLPTATSKHVCKIIVIGDRSTGISSLVDRFVHNTFESSIRNAFRVRQTHVHMHGINVQLKIVDKQSSIQRTPFSNVLYKGKIALLLAFDLTNRTSFIHLSQHINELERHVLQDTSKDRITPIRASTPSSNTFGLLPKILVGLKSDCDIAERQISFIQASLFARKNNMPYVEVSAKNDISCDLPFYLGAEAIAQQHSWKKNM